MSRILSYIFWLGLGGFVITGILIVLILIRFEQDLPDVETLKNVHLQVPLRIYTREGKLIEEFGEMRRTPVTIDQVPPQLINAVLATEDQRYFEHVGVDPVGLIRAAFRLVRSGNKEEGGSTITMQVARNFFLTRKKTYSRKLKEILLAIRIDRMFSKDKVLELYLNKVYLGNRSYGVAAAAQVYYGKPLNELSLAQLAMLAGLPKAPSTLNPIANPQAALKRRNHVLGRMLEHGYINQHAYDEACQEPVTAALHSLRVQVDAPYIAEMVRNALYTAYGPDAYTNGFQIYTTISQADQSQAQNTLRNTLLAYDQRHGYRGPLGNLGSTLPEDERIWVQQLKKHYEINGLLPAVVIRVEANSAFALLSDDQPIEISWKNIAWARKAKENNRLGPNPRQVSDVLKIGDVIRVMKTEDGSWRLAQIPEVEAGFVALNPTNGAVLALVGGFDFVRSNFNRVIQAQRQAGSGFKPFIYSAALAKGYTLATVFNDAPIVINDPSHENYWRPQNDTHKFYGPTRLRVALTKSRNLVSIRLLDAIGLPYALDYLKNFGFEPKRLPQTLSLALGSGTVTPLEMARGYAVFANGGFLVDPFIIDHITDAWGKIVYQEKPKIACDNCDLSKQAPDTKLAPRVVSPQVAYLINSVLQDVIWKGTAKRATVLKRLDVAGKTGTTNDKVDAWFNGYNGDIVATVWVGFDQPRPLNEYGSQVALPMWIDFMKVALQGLPENSMQRPTNLVTIRINARTGKPATARDNNTIFETFRSEDAPKSNYGRFTNTSNTYNNSDNRNNDNSGNDELF